MKRPDTQRIGGGGGIARIAGPALWPLWPFAFLFIVHPVSPDTAVPHAVVASVFAGWARLGIRIDRKDPADAAIRFAAALPPALFALGYAAHLDGIDIALRGLGSFSVCLALAVSESFVRERSASRRTKRGQSPAEKEPQAVGFAATLLAAVAAGGGIFFAASLMSAWAEAATGSVAAAATLYLYHRSSGKTV